ncbi:MAG: arsenate reductase ArsC [Candidatus Margulisbacteria bacterium]|nr:arsenate reductase ArsC [Candidatus Margulisiibacteriota bacterium]
MKKLLIVCTGNSCRSQMAEGIARHLYGDICEVHSAGTHPSYVHPTAIEVMEEINIDISGHRSRSVEEFKDELLDVVITVCDHAKENCPLFSNAKTTLHWPFRDPVGPSNIILFREVRDEIFEKLKSDLRPLLR